MKFSLAALALVLTTGLTQSSHAEVTKRFECETEKMIKAGSKRATIHKFSFDLIEQDGSFQMAGASDETSAVTVEPESSQLYVLGVYDVSSVQKLSDRLKFSGDDIGIVIGDMELFDDAAWTAGWVKTRNTSDPKDRGSYSNVTCIVTTL